MSGRRMRIVMPGGSGQVGRVLAAYFQERGHHVTVLTRGPYTAPWQTVHWDGVNRGPWIETLEGADVCIHLSGRSVNCRATAKNRKSLYDSRIGTTRLVGDAISVLDNPPRVWLNASTATIYRHSLHRDMDETTGEIGGGEWISKRRRAPVKWNWTIHLVKDWETAFFAAKTPRTRKVALRTSLVFSSTPGSIFEVFSNLVRASMGGAQGNGRQYVSWIHEADYARAVEFLMEQDEIEGPVNVTSPNPLPNREFMQALRDAWGVPNGLPAPAPLIRLGAIFLRTEPELVLKSRRVVPGRLLNAGFRFEFPAWAGAAQNLVAQWRLNSGQ
ncbi:MAG TPA: TIGR01777 family oxidoreductase [Terracidiphilus sp.]|nr:TIGR01777 family oxidoreductase [Terracidiphilus sp.]